MKMRTLIHSLAFAALGLSAGMADAQTYPVQTPVYIPSAVLAAQTLSAPGTVVFNSNGLGTIILQVTGTYTGLTSAVQITASRGASPTWVTTGAIPKGSPASGKPTNSITANGTYEINANGAAQVRLNVTALSTGSVVVTASGTPGFFHTPANVDLGALITNTAQAAGTVNSPDQLGGEVTSVECVFNQTANTAGSTTFSIQNKDAASGLYYTLVTSAAVTTANNTPSAIAAGAGVQTTSNVSSSLPIGATWRVQEVAGGTSTTGTIGCVAH